MAAVTTRTARSSTMASSRSTNSNNTVLTTSTWTSLESSTSVISQLQNAFDIIIDSMSPKFRGRSTSLSSSFRSLSPRHIRHNMRLEAKRAKAFALSPLIDQTSYYDNEEDIQNNVTIGVNSIPQYAWGTYECRRWIEANLAVVKTTQERDNTSSPPPSSKITALFNSRKRTHSPRRGFKEDARREGRIRIAKRFERDGLEMYGMSEVGWIECLGEYDAGHAIFRALQERMREWREAVKELMEAEGVEMEEEMPEEEWWAKRGPNFRRVGVDEEEEEEEWN